MSIPRKSGLAVLFVLAAALAVLAVRDCGDAGPHGPAPADGAAATEDVSAADPGAPRAPRPRRPRDGRAVIVETTQATAGPSVTRTTPPSPPAPPPPPTDFADGPAAPGEVVGKVLLLPDRTPIRGARVRQHLVRDHDLAVTGANGIFRVGGLAPGDARFEVAVEGRPARTFAATVPEGAGVDGIEVLFGGGGGAIEGRIAAAGAPLVGVLVRLNRPGTGGGKGLLQARTGPDGAFRFDDLPPADWNVEADAGGHRTRAARVTVAAGETARVTFDGAASVVGVLSDDGAPVPGAIVRATRIVPSYESAHDLTASDGSYRIDGLGPADWQVGVQVLGDGAFSTNVRGATLVPGENRIDVDLARGESSGEISGRVFAKATGAGLSSQQAQVTLAALVEKAEGAWDLGPGSHAGMAFADASGAFRFRGLRPGRYQIQVSPRVLLRGATRDVALALGERRTGLEIALEDRPPPDRKPSVSVLSGTVLDAGERPVVGAFVRATAAADPNRMRSAITDDAGRYRIEGLDPGTWRVTVTAQGPGGFSAEVADVAVAAGANTLPIRLDHGALAGEIRGRILAASSGRALTARDVSVTLTALPADGLPRFVGSAAIEDDGTIRFRSLREGRYRISAHPRAGGLRFREVDVAVGRGEKVAGVEIALEDLATGKVVVVARDAEGRPVTEVLLVFGDEGTYTQGTTNAHSSSGIFETWVEAGTHALTVRTWSGALRATTTVVVRAGESTKADVVLRPE